MASPEFTYLDSTLPAELLDGPLRGLDKKIDYRRRLNLAINSSTAEMRLSQLHNALLKEVKPNSNLTFREYNIGLESYLALLLSTTTISDLSSSSLSHHFQKRKLLIPEHHSSPSTQYMERLLFGSQKSWGTKFGTLGYFLHLSENDNHYLHPSTSADLCLRQMLDFMRDPNIPNFFNFCRDYKNSYLQDDPFYDVYTYQRQVEVLKSIPEVSQMIQLLTLIETVVPNIIKWYLKPLNSGEPILIPEEDSSEYLAYELARSIGQLCTKTLLDDSSFQNIVYKFVHQELSPLFYEWFDQFLLIRKKSAFNSLNSTFTELENLISPLVTQITLNTPSGLLKLASRLVLDKLSPPGGYNTFLVANSISLLNRAYIISHPTQNPFKDLFIAPVRDSFQPFVQLLGRVYRLVYLAGTSLLKSNLDHLQITGHNLLKLSTLYEDEKFTSIQDLSK